MIQSLINYAKIEKDASGNQSLPLSMAAWAGIKIVSVAGRQK